jgi:hypothetical protein
MVAGASGRGGGAVVLARSEWRTRGRSHLVIVVLVAVTVATSLAAFCAADRSRTTFERLREATHASDLTLLISSGNPEASLKTLRETDGILGVRAMSRLLVRPESSDLVPSIDLLAIAPRLDDRKGQVDVPVITEGRAPRPDRPDEIALNAKVAGDLGVGPGDDLRLVTMTKDWINDVLNGAAPGAPDGPRLTATVTGIARSPADFGKQTSVIHLTPAFVERYDRHMGREDAIHVRARPDVAERFREGELIELIKTPTDESPFDDLETTDDGLGTVSTALRLVGAAAATTGAVAVALSLARAARASAPDRATMRAIGWTRRDERRSIALAMAPALVVGLAVGGLVGVLASPRAMVGLAAAIEPRPGSVLVSPLLVGAVVGTATLVVAASLLAVVLTQSVRRSAGAASRVVSIPVSRPLALTLGLRQAVVGPVARGGRTSRGAIVAVALSAAIGLGALVVSSSIGRLQDDHSLTGERPERVVDSGGSRKAYAAAMARLESDDRVDVLAAQHMLFATLRGLGELMVLVNEPRRGQIHAPIVEGRMPRTGDEVALGPETAEETGTQIGEVVRLGSEEATGSFRVVGTVLFPEGDFSHDEGVSLTVAGATRIVGDVATRPYVVRQVVFDWAPGVDADVADRELVDEQLLLLAPGEGIRFTPSTVSNLGEVEHLPRQLALFVGVLAAATLLHAAWTGVHLRARELVTLRAIGLTRRSTSLLTAMHVVAIVTVGVVLGLPPGMAIGRTVWRAIAERAHLLVRPDLDWSWLGAAVGVTSLVSLAVAGLAARWTGRLRPSALRTE